MKKYKKTIAFIGVLIFSMLFALIFKWIQTGSPFKAETIMVGAIIFLNTLIMGSIAYKSFQKYSTESAQQLKKRILPAFVRFVLIAFFISLSLVSIGVYAFYLIKGLDTSNFLNQLFEVELSEAIKQFAIWILIGSAIFFYVIWRKAIGAEQNLREENLKYKYQNLKSQVNPHFLFNSMNTLSEMVYEDARKADNYIQDLSKIYRYVLENEEVDLVPLSSEIEFVKQYFNLQKARDSDKVQLEFHIADTEIFRVIPVSIQILVENALKHNSRSEKSPLIIQISMIDNYIVVSNTIQRKNILENTSKTGLSNLKERVKLILDSEMVIQEENNQFIVKLPVIQSTK